MSRLDVSYARVAWCYDELAAAWSFGAIPRAKSAAVADVVAGEHVCFAGVGRGSDALIAARAGARVCAVDIAGAMLRRLEARAATAGLEIECRQTSLFEYAPAAPCDRVVANFVLNVFDDEELERALDSLVGWLRPRGALAVADFAPPQSSLARRALANAHYWPVALSARALGLCALHPIRDYRAGFEARGLELVSTRDIGLYRVQHFERG